MPSTRPKILRRLMAQLRDKGMGMSQAGAIATKQLQRDGILKPGTMELTEYGRQRDEMSAEERAIDRQAKRTGRSPLDFNYSPDTNRATLNSSARKRKPSSGGLLS